MDRHNCIYQHKEFMIIKVDTGFIVYNKRKPWDQGHSHISNYNTCKCAIILASKRELPKIKNKYFIKTLIRISNNKEYVNKLQDLLIDFKKMMEDDTEIDSSRCH